jgi:putative FmdB family regulatory protein
MPTYVYECTKGHRFERVQSIKDAPLKRCPRCRARVTRVPSAGAGLIFKGSGFYITDYRSKGYREKAKQEGGAGPTAPAGGSEKKPEGTSRKTPSSES